MKYKCPKTFIITTVPTRLMLFNHAIEKNPPALVLSLEHFCGNGLQQRDGRDSRFFSGKHQASPQLNWGQVFSVADFY